MRGLRREILVRVACPWRRSARDEQAEENDPAHGSTLTRRLLFGEFAPLALVAMTEREPDAEPEEEPGADRERDEQARHVDSVQRVDSFLSTPPFSGVGPKPFLLHRDEFHARTFRAPALSSPQTFSVSACFAATRIRAEYKFGQRPWFSADESRYDSLC